MYGILGAEIDEHGRRLLSRWLIWQSPNPPGCRIREDKTITTLELVRCSCLYFLICKLSLREKRASKICER